MTVMSSSAAEPHLPPAGERAVRAHAGQLRSLAAKHGITELRFAAPGKLVGHVAEDRDLFDVVDFEAEAEQLMGHEVDLYSDRVLSKPNVSPELIEAKPL